MSTEEKTALFGQWVEQYTNDLLNWAYHKTSNLAVAEDLTQDTFLVAFQQMGCFREESSPKTWLFAILKNKITDYFRGQFKNRNINIQDIKEEGFTPFDSDEKWISQHAPLYWDNTDEHELDNTDFRQILGYCLKLLPSRWKAALELKYFTHKKGDVISQELGISTSNYWQIVHRAKLQLRDCLEVNWFKNQKNG